MMRTFIFHFTLSKHFYNFLIILVTHIFFSNKKPGKPLIVRAFPAFPGQSPTDPTTSLFLTFILLGYNLYYLYSSTTDCFFALIFDVTSIIHAISTSTSICISFIVFTILATSTSHCFRTITNN